IFPRSWCKSKKLRVEPMIHWMFARKGDHGLIASFPKFFLRWTVIARNKNAIVEDVQPPLHFTVIKRNMCVITVFQFLFCDLTLSRVVANITPSQVKAFLDEQFSPLFPLIGTSVEKQDPHLLGL